MRLPSFVFAIVVGIVSTLGTLYFLNTEQIDWEFIKSLLLYVVPIIVGGIVVPLITNSWQITKERLKIKRDIISDFEKSDKRRSLLLDSFAVKVLESYMFFEDDGTGEKFEEYSHPDKEIEVFIKFPSEESEMPLTKFNDDYKKLIEEVNETVYSGNRLMSSIRLYYNNSELEKELKKIEDILDESEDYLQRFMHSKNAKELIKFYRMYLELNDPILNSIKKSEEKLIEMKFHNITI